MLKNAAWLTIIVYGLWFLVIMLVLAPASICSMAASLYDVSRPITIVCCDR